MITIISIHNSPSPRNFLSSWMTVTFAILADPPMCTTLNFEAALRLKPICARGWIAWITFASPPLPSYGFTNTWLLPNFHGQQLSFTSLDLSLSFAKHIQASVAVECRLSQSGWSSLPHPANVTTLYTGSSKRAGLRITHLATFWKQIQAVLLDILQQSSDSRCSRLYDRLLLRQERWSRRYAPWHGSSMYVHWQW